MEIISPHHEQLLQQGSDIEFKVIARDPNGYIPKVQLSYGNTLLGTSEIVFETPPAPGTPIAHTVVLSNAPARAYHGITLRGYDPAGNSVTTNRIWIAVGPNPDRVTLGLHSFMREASERLTNGLPAAAVFKVHRVFGPTNQPVQFSLSLEGTAENGRDYESLSLSGVLAAGVSFTNFVINPIPDELAEGSETLLVRLVDPQCWTANSANDVTNSACYMVSTNSEIEFTIHDAPPANIAGVQLRLELEDGVASEAPLNGVMDTAIFRVRRASGPIDEEVRFAISLKGAADWGDYEPIDQIVTMAPHQSFADVVIRPIGDNINEGPETVILTLTDYDCGKTNTMSVNSAFGRVPSCYDVVGINVAQATILDSRDGTNHPPRVTITTPHDGTVIEEGEGIEVQVEALDLEGRLNTAVLYMNDQPIKQVSPAWPGPGTNYVFVGELQFAFTTNLPAGEHTFTAMAIDYPRMEGYSTPVRVLVRAKDTTRVVSEVPLSFERTKRAADRSLRLTVRGGAGQVCNLESSSDLQNWEPVVTLFLPGGTIEFEDQEPSTQRYFRLVEE